LAKEKAYDAMLYIFAGLILIFALMQIQTQVTVMLIVAYVISIITFVIFFNKYNKEI
jgi:Ca2+/Na+ antiporter